jgi:hypothetical protein
VGRWLAVWAWACVVMPTLKKNSRPISSGRRSAPRTFD